MRKLILQSVSVAVLAMLVCGGVAQAQSSQVGLAAPDFLLQRLDGGDAALDDFRGQVLLVFFFGFN